MIETALIEPLISGGISLITPFIKHILTTSRQNESIDKLLNKIDDYLEQKALYEEKSQILSHRYKIQQSIVSSNLEIEKELIIKDHDLKEKNSPFVSPVDHTIELIKQRYRINKRPIVLVTPFWDDMRSSRSNDQGGFVNYRSAISQKLEELRIVEKLDGFIERPLRHSDLDINLIYNELHDIPVVLIHGNIQSNLKIQPKITAWNLFPIEDKRYVSLNLTIIDNSIYPTGNIGKAQLDLQSYIAHSFYSAIALMMLFREQFNNEMQQKLVKQLELEAHTIAELGYNDIKIESVNNGYGMIVKNPMTLESYGFWIPTNYPNVAPNFFIIKNRKYEQIPISEWHSNCSTIDLINAIKSN